MFTPDIELPQPRTVRASAVLTNAYVAGTLPVSFDHHNALGIEVNYTKGDETSMQLKVEVSNDPAVASPTWAQQTTETTSSGTITVALGERSFSATGVYSIFLTPMRAAAARISVKATGGTPTGTVAIRAYPTWC
jgi:hypothetical protein